MNETLTYDKIYLLRLAFKGLEDHELEEVAALTEFRTYPPSSILCHEGAYEDVLYIIADGEIVISQKIIDGEEERILRVGGRGDIVGEMALIQSAPRAATVRTTSECTVLEMKKDDFETILSRSPRMAIDLIRITLDRIRANDKKMIADLQKTNQVLRQLDRNKLEFILIAAHELRTPLTVLNGYVNVMRAIPETQTNADLSQATETPEIKGDPALIQKALYQLIINAIKYTPDGGKIMITTRPSAFDDNSPSLEIAVRDRGIGLDAEHHDLVFEKFYQVGAVALHSSGKTTFKGGGPGLGLALVRGVARAHGGKVWVESTGHDEVNFTGSTFYLMLPLAPPNPSK